MDQERQNQSLSNEEYKVGSTDFIQEDDSVVIVAPIPAQEDDESIDLTPDADTEGEISLIKHSDTADAFSRLRPGGPAAEDRTSQLSDVSKRAYFTFSKLKPLDPDLQESLCQALDLMKKTLPSYDERPQTRTMKDSKQRLAI